MLKIRQHAERQLKQQQQMERLKRHVRAVQSEETDESEHVLAVRDFHEFELNEEKLHVAAMSLVL